MTHPAPSQLARCPSTLRLDQHRLQQLDPCESAEVEAHLAGCARCRGQLLGLQQERSRFEARLEPVPPWLERVSSRRWRSTQAVLALAVALVVVALGSWASQQGPSRGGEPKLRLKGDISFGAYIKHNHQVRLAHEGDMVEPGDALRFFYRQASPGYFAIIDIDGSGAVTAFHPLGVQAEAVRTQTRQVLPNSTILDTVPGREQIFAVFCEHPFLVEDVLDRVREGGPSALAQEGCQRYGLTLRKRDSSGP